MAEIGLGNVINITLSALPQGLTKYKTNNIALFSNETSTSTQPFITAISAADVEKVYGTNSVTAKMARAIFTPANNLRTGDGTLFVFNYDGTNAISGSAETVAITSTKINAIKNVTNGSLKIAIDGVDKQLSGLNMTAVKTGQDIVDILNAQGLDCDIEWTSSQKILITSRNCGSDSSIELKSSTEGTDLGGSTMLDASNATTVDGEDSDGTTLLEAVNDAEQQAFFGGILTTQICENDAILANSTGIQAKDHIYFECIQSLENISELGADIKAAGNSKTRTLAYSSNGIIGAKQAIATYATIASSVNFTGNDVCLTMNLKTLTGISPDKNLNQSYLDASIQNGVDVYGSLEGLGCVFSNDNNGYTDDIVNQLWIKKDLEVAGFNYLRQTNTKVPQTEAGMIGLKNAYQTVLEQGVRNGFIGVGIGWSDQTPIPFGDPEDFKRNIEENGYYVYSLPVSQQSQEDREARKAPLIQIAIKSAGAIHSSNVLVLVSR